MTGMEGLCPSKPPHQGAGHPGPPEPGGGGPKGRSMRHPCPQHQPPAHQDHRQRQQLPHRGPGEKEAEMRVRLAEELADDAGHAIAGEEGAREEARPRADRLAAGEQHQQREQRDAFQTRLIQLRRMPRLGSAGREDHGPGHVRGDPAPQFAVDEVGEPAEEQPDRHHADDAVGEGHPVDRVAARIEPGGDDHAQRPAMEGHAAMPDGQRLPRGGDIVAGAVEQHIAQPPPEDDAERRPGDVVVHLLGRRDPRRPLHKATRDAPADHDAGDVGQRIPADGDRTDLDQHRVDHREGDGEEHQAKGSSAFVSTSRT